MANTSLVAAIVVLLTISAMSLVEGEAEVSRKPYIVQMMKNMKPHHFDLNEKWYSSMLSQVSESNTGIDMLYTYDNLLHGFAARMSKAEAEAMATIDGCLGVIPSSRGQLATTRTPEFLGLTSFSSSSSPGVWSKYSTYGEDIIIGVLDTGIWPESQSFKDEGLGPIPSKWKGECETGREFNASHCNKKIIGARYFFKGYEIGSGPINETLEYKSPRDNDGHWTHTASTIAGAQVPATSFFGFAYGTASGTAPRARLAIYKVCWAGVCDDADVAAAMEKAVADGVDIISLSITSLDQPFYMDVKSIVEFGAMEKGVFVSSAAGNDGPRPSSINNPAPWITTVGAGSIDRDFPASLVLGNQDILRGTSTYRGKTKTEGSIFQDGPFPLVYLSMNNSSRYCLDGGVDPIMVKGKIVVCERGNTTFSDKSNVVARAGGAGVIVANRAVYGEDQWLTNPEGLPAIHVGFRAGEKIKAYIDNAGVNATATLRLPGLTLVGNTVAAPMAALFSSRGPTVAFPHILKPDLIAPGVSILAAYAQVVENRPYEFVSGTSMACPHVSGIAALIKEVHPTWSPSAIKSALITSSYIVDNTQHAIRDVSTMKRANPFATGAGHVDPMRAVNPGLVYDMGPQDYVNFLCTLNYTSQQISLLTKKMVSCPTSPSLEVGDLNYPSFSVLFKSGKEMVQVKRRRVTDVGPQGRAVYRASVKSPRGVKISVHPEILEFRNVEEKARYSARFETNITSPSASHQFGEIRWKCIEGGTKVVLSPVVLQWYPAN